METTPNKIRDQRTQPRRDGWIKLLRSLNKIKPDDEPLAISYIIKSNGLEDAIWCLRAMACAR